VPGFKTQAKRGLRKIAEEKNTRFVEMPNYDAQAGVPRDVPTIKAPGEYADKALQDHPSHPVDGMPPPFTLGGS
jgi:hypothetical protein